VPVGDDESQVAGTRVIHTRVIDLLRIPWLSVNQTRLSRLTDVPMPLLALDVQRAGTPGQPGANVSAGSAAIGTESTSVEFLITATAVGNEARTEPWSEARAIQNGVASQDRVPR